MPQNTATIVGGIVAAAAIAAGVWYFRDQFGSETATVPAARQPVTPTAPIPTIQHPLPETGATEGQLPALEESDVPVLSALSEVFSQGIENFLVTDQLVRKIVVTVDNLPRQKLAARMNPVKPTGGTFATSGTDDTLALSDTNYARYEALARIIANADMKQAADRYVRMYPLFQQAYQELGYSEGYFNDRLVTVIDHLLTTPDAEGPILLRQPGVFYEYTDPKLEQLSVGQKALLRIGPQQAQTVKAKLKEFRDHIASNSR